MLLLFRALPRAVVLLLLTFGCSAAMGVSRLARPFAERWQIRVRNAIFRFWARRFAHLVGMQIDVVGRPPEGDFILVTNHVSYMDVVLLAGQFDAAFVAKSGLRSWPGIGLVVTSADSIYIDRDRRRDIVRVMKLIERSLERRLGVVIFPEGLAGSGEVVHRFRPSLLELPARLRRPVHYATIGYRTLPGHPPARDAVCWWGGAPFVPHVLSLLRMRRFEARLVFGEEPVLKADRKALAHELRERILAAFEPMGPPVDPLSQKCRDRDPGLSPPPGSPPQ